MFVPAETGIRVQALDRKGGPAAVFVGDRIVAGLCLASFAAPFFTAHRFGLVAIAFSMALVMIAAVRRCPPLIHLSLLVALMNLSILVPVLWETWPLYFLVPLVVYGLIVMGSRALRSSARWVHPGRLGKGEVVWIVLIMAISSAALPLWVALARPDLRSELAIMPRIGYPWIVLVGIVFSVVNALLEETVWRGVMMQSLSELWGEGGSTLSGQALSFGFAHVRGFPSGASGMVLATIYGYMLGYLRRRSGGMLSPIVAHICADATIFVILLHMARR